MDRDIIRLPVDADFAAVLRQSEAGGGLKHVVVTRGDRIAGVLRVNTDFRRAQEDTGIALGDVAQRTFVIARQDDIVFDLVTRMSRRGASMAVVVSGRGRPRARDVLGVISKEHVADSVADSIRPYAV